MANELPTNVGYGTVTGRFLLAYADGVDSNLYPDGAPAKGTVLFTPSAAYVKNVNASPAPVTILPATIECSLDSEGYLIGPDSTRAVRLVATDDADNNPVDWTWRVDFRLTDQTDTPTRGITSFHFELPQGTTVDLTTAAPVPDANGTYYLIGPTGPANSLSIGTVTTGAAGSSASAAITGTAPTQTLSLTIPRGDAGVDSEITVGTVTTGSPGSSASVTNSGTVNDVVLDFTIPRGDKGDKGDTGATGATGPVGPTGATGITWQGVWSSTVDYVNNDAVYYDNSSWFASGNPTVGETPSLSATHWYPLALHGATGATGPQGDAATITVGTVTTGSPSSSATVTNVGTSGAAVFNFSIPKGDTGDIGNISATSPITYTSNTIALDHSAIQFIDGGTA
jgi:hypothetical protein